MKVNKPSRYRELEDFPQGYDPDGDFDTVIQEVGSNDVIWGIAGPEYDGYICDVSNKHNKSVWDIYESDWDNKMKPAMEFLKSLPSK